MFKHKHASILKQDRDAWKRWRDEHAHIRPDLSQANLSESLLSGVDLSGTTLRGANLSGIDLSGANLSRANLSLVNLREADLSHTNLRKTNLRGADLNQVDLSDADLREADLRDANLSFAFLRDVRLNNADLRNSQMNGADLRGADLISTNLSRVNLSGANLCGTDLSGADLSGTNLMEARFAYTMFTWVDLSLVSGLETAIHQGPSTVNINSVIFPLDEHVRNHFLRGAGFSDTAIEYLPSILISAAIQHSSLLISYANPDQAVARRLYKGFQDENVRCWMAPHGSGDNHFSRIDEIIHFREKVLLLLSEHTVSSSWVEYEVQAVLTREVTQDRPILFPLCLDQAVIQTDKHWATRLRESRPISDFTNIQDDAAYQRAFTTLLGQLKVTQLPV